MLFGPILFSRGGAEAQRWGWFRVVNLGFPLVLSGRMKKQSKTDSPYGGWVLKVSIGWSLSAWKLRI